MLERILSRPIEQLIITYKPLPNIQVLRLYREVLKFSFQFYWNNQKGQCWRDVLRKMARKEFDQSRNENDHILIMKMMVTTRQSMNVLRDKMFQTQTKLEQTIVERQRMNRSDSYRG